MAPPSKYKTDEEKRKAYLESQSRFAAKKWNCDICHVKIRRGNKINHLKSKKHLQSTSTDKLILK